MTGRGRPRGHWAHLMLVLAGAGVLVAGLSCPAGTDRPAARPSVTAGALTLFFTGRELGSLKPCGCSGGQLGGLEKRPAIFREAPASNRLIVATGDLVEGDREQDLIKFRILFEALRELHYDVVLLTDRDADLAGRLDLLADPQQAFSVLRGDGEGRTALFERRFVCQGREMAVRIAGAGAEEASAEQAAALLEEAREVPTLDILVLQQYDPNSLAALAAQTPGVECIICPSADDEPRVLSRPGARPLIFTVGRFGRYVCRLDVTLDRRTGEPVPRFEAIAVGEKLADDEALVQLYRQYQQLVADANLLEKQPRVPLPDGLSFIGSSACARCHEFEHGKWSTRPHAGAYAALRKVGSDRDPECVVCHVVGLEYESGFVNREKTPHLTDVGCESCHGPGSRHAETVGQATTVPPRMHCRDCHTPERSAGYAGHEEEYMQKIVHWREPAAAGDVKH
jgi:hypothetical protein